MTLCERAASSGLEISLECDRTLFVRELDDDIDIPWSAGSRVRATSVVVSCKSCRDVRCQAGVVARGLTLVFQDVDETLAEARRGALQSYYRQDVVDSSERLVRSAGSCGQFLREAADVRCAKTSTSGSNAKRRLVGPPSRLCRYGGQPSRGLPTVAHALVGKRERRLVDQTGASWNQIASWLQQIEALQRAF